MADRDFQCRRRREPCPLGHVAPDDKVGPSQHVPLLLHCTDHATHVIGPGCIGTRLDGCIDRKAIGGIVLVQRQDMQPVVVACPRCHHRAEVNCTWQNEALVVVGMFTDQIDSSGSLRDNRGSMPMTVFKSAYDAVLQKDG